LIFQIVIGAAANEAQPEQRISKPFVIGAAAGDSRFDSRPTPTQTADTVVVGVLRGNSPSTKFELHPNLRSASERSGVVIGLRNDRRRK
jgi:hypothetical protein